MTTPQQITEQLWTAEDVAAYLRLAPRVVVERVRYAPGFPRPVRVTGPRGKLTWVPQEVRAWAMQRRG